MKSCIWMYVPSHTNIIIPVSTSRHIRQVVICTIPVSVAPPSISQIYRNVDRYFLSSTHIFQSLLPVILGRSFTETPLPRGYKLLQQSQDTLFKCSLMHNVLRNELYSCSRWIDHIRYPLSLALDDINHIIMLKISGYYTFHFQYNFLKK